MRFTQVAANAFSELQLNAGVLLTDFDPTNPPTVEEMKPYIFMATSGGASFTAVPEYLDFGDDIDNVPANTKELKVIDYYTATLSGTGKTVNADVINRLVGAADNTTGSGGLTTITPRGLLEEDDFSDIWWVGDYSDKNGNVNGGYLAIQLIDALNTSGFSLTSNDNGKADFSFEFTAHYSLADVDAVPFNIYLQTGSAEPSGTTA